MCSPLAPESRVPGFVYALNIWHCHETVRAADPKGHRLVGTLELTGGDAGSGARPTVRRRSSGVAEPV